MPRTHPDMTIRKYSLDDILKIVEDPDKQYSYDPAEKPPPFGHPLKVFWAFDQQTVNLNHGSYGSLPLPVLTACNKLYWLAEQNPDLFLRRTYMPLLEDARAEVADLIGANADEVVLVPNATHGVNTILHNFEWKEGDIILEASTTYGAVSNLLHYLSDRSEQPRPILHTLPLTFPLTHREIRDSFRAKLVELKQQYSNITFSDTPPDSRAPGKVDRSGNKIVAVIDSIVSNPGVLLPWQELVQICKEEGVWSVVDAAHSIGQDVGVNLNEAKPDFWVSNCHKWLYSKRGCAVLYVPKRNQYIIKTSLPTSFAYTSPTDSDRLAPESQDTHFVDQHEWTGTTDQINYISVVPAVAFRKWLGGELAINNYCRQLALDGGKKLAEVLGTRVMDESGELTLNMTNVLLPLPVEKEKGKVYAPGVLSRMYIALQEKTLVHGNAYGTEYFHGGAWWARASAQVWNELEDFEVLGNALKTACQEIKEQFNLPSQ